MRRVLLVNWDGYPNVAHGGVYTWEKALVEEMRDWEFLVYNQLSNSNSNSSFRVPKNVVGGLAAPLYGTTRAEEFNSAPYISKVVATSQKVIEQHFVPRFLRLVSALTASDCDPDEVTSAVMQLHRFFMRFDYKKCTENPAVWEAFLRLVRKDPLYREMSLNEALRVYQMLQRTMQILAVRIPKVDLVHCSLAWLPSLISVVAKVEQGVPVIFTEHGVAFRELLLYYNGYTFDEASKMLMKVIAANIVKTLYSVADVVSPVCHANTEWEKHLGLPPQKVRVIYNGIDTKRFRPLASKRVNRPLVVFVGRIEIFKDVISLISAMRLVREEVPDVLCEIYGEATDLEYARKCAATVKELGLTDTVKFMGKTNEPEKAYNRADVVAMSSLTEAFPFAAIEAMACAKPVVATDVGGTREALEGCGILARSRNEAELARGIVRILKDDALRARLGEAAVLKAREKFELALSANNYRQLYEEVLESKRRVTEPQVVTVR